VRETEQSALAFMRVKQHRRDVAAAWTPVRGRQWLPCSFLVRLSKNPPHFLSLLPFGYATSS
jgi:hypothetical protein